MLFTKDLAQRAGFFRWAIVICAQTGKIQLMNTQLKTLLPLLRPYKGRMLVAFLASILGVGALLGLVQVVRVLVDSTLASGATSQELQSVLAIFIALAATMALATYLRTVHFKMVGEYVVARLRQKAFGHVLGLDATFFEQQRSGETTSRLTADVAVLQHALETSLPIALRGGFQAAGGIALMVYTSLHLSGVILSVVAVVMVLAVLFGRVVRNYGRQVQEFVGNANARITESLQGVRVVQSLNQQEMEEARLEETLNQQLKLANKYNHARGGFFAFAILSLFCAMAAVFWFGGNAVFAGNISQGELTAFLVYSLIAALGVGSLIEVFAALSNAGGAAQRLFDLLGTKSSIADPQTPKTLPEAKKGRSLSFEGVTFTYPNKTTPTLEDISFKAGAGEMVAIVGMSGAGKSTIFQLIPRFFEPQKGRISLDGVAINKLALSQLRREVGVVAQDVFLFAGSVLDNIRYGKTDATDAEVKKVAKQAFADKFIKDLPEGYQTQIGERGVKLSGGQRQRIAIARTLLQAPALLLLDEATSHLDAASEEEVQKALARAQTGRTTLAIAHRLATVKAAKTIIVIDEGRIVATGTHKELMTNDPLYRKLATLQFMAFD